MLSRLSSELRASLAIVQFLPVMASAFWHTQLQCLWENSLSSSRADCASISVWQWAWPPIQIVPGCRNRPVRQTRELPGDIEQIGCRNRQVRQRLNLSSLEAFRQVSPPRDRPEDRRNQPRIRKDLKARYQPRTSWWSAQDSNSQPNGQNLYDGWPFLISANPIGGQKRSRKFLSKGSGSFFKRDFCVH
jgi:hypothetical protein